MILDVQPIAHVLSLSIDRQLLVVQGVGDHQPDQLLREVVRTVVYSSSGRSSPAGRRCGDTPAPADPRLPSRRNTGWTCESASLGEEQVGTVERQIAVNLVGRYLMIALDAVLAAGVHQRRRAHDVGLKEDARVLDGAVHVALRRKVRDNVRDVNLW